MEIKIELMKYLNASINMNKQVNLLFEQFQVFKFEFGVSGREKTLFKPCLKLSLKRKIII